MQLAHCNLSTVEDVAHLAECPSITSLDLQGNRLDGDGSALLDVLAAMPELAVLYLQGNPCVRSIRHYRKHVLGRLPKLRFLDDRPVFDDERGRVDVWYAAWTAGGDSVAAAAERAEMARQVDAKKAEVCGGEGKVCTSRASAPMAFRCSGAAVVVTVQRAERLCSGRGCAAGEAAVQRA